MNTLIGSLVLTQKDIKNICEILEEAASDLRGVMETKEAQDLKIRWFLPDELEGSALMLREHFSKEIK